MFLQCQKDPDCKAEGRVQGGDRAAAPPTKWVKGGKREDGLKFSDFWGNMKTYCGVSSAECRSQTESCPAHPSLAKSFTPSKTTLGDGGVPCFLAAQINPQALEEYYVLLDTGLICFFENISKCVCPEMLFVRLSLQCSQQCFIDRKAQGSRNTQSDQPRCRPFPQSLDTRCPQGHANCLEGPSSNAIALCGLHVRLDCIKGHGSIDRDYSRRGSSNRCSGSLVQRRLDEIVDRVVACEANESVRPLLQRDWHYPTIEAPNSIRGKNCTEGVPS